MINRITGCADCMKMLGRLIDKASVAELVEALAVECANRAAIAAEHWQDTERAKEWINLTNAANRLASEADELRT